MVPPNNLGPDLNGKYVNETQYRGMIGSLMYLIASRPDIQFSTFLCARYQANPKESHLIVVKRIFRYLKGTPSLGKLVCWSAKKQQSVAISLAEVEYVAAVGCCANILWMKSQLTDYDIIYEKGYMREIGAKETLKKSCLPPRWRLANGRSFNAIVDYAKIIWEDLIHKLNKKTREKIVPYPRFISLLLEHMAPKYDNEELTINPTQVFSVYNWILKPNQPEKPPFTDHMKAIYNLDVPVDSKAPKYSSPTEEVPQGKKPGARSGLKRKLSSKHTSESTTKASKSQSGHSKKETKSSSAINTSPSHPSPPTLVVGEMHKEAQQAAGGPTCLINFFHFAL
ncbi:hypothetical protein Tco_1128673 [Tanacetum coccineum]